MGPAITGFYDQYREAATNNLKKLVEKFGTEWAQQTVIPKVGVEKFHYFVGLLLFFVVRWWPCRATRTTFTDSPVSSLSMF